jgi:hypothetical protein
MDPYGIELQFEMATTCQVAHKCSVKKKFAWLWPVSHRATGWHGQETGQSAFQVSC